MFIIQKTALRLTLWVAEGDVLPDLGDVLRQLGQENAPLLLVLGQLGVHPPLPARHIHHIIPPQVD